ncbi:MAG: metallophosphoesterase [Synergistaceae bacterium]|nr:metallophosphoesterase [Synergistaceae bacterium]
MYEALALGALLFILRKLNEAGVPKTALNIFAVILILWLALGFAAGFDFRNAEYDFFPYHFAEIVRALNMNVIIITLYGFIAFLLVCIAARFAPFTKQKALCSVILMIIVTVYSMWEAYNIQPRYITVPTKKLPAGTDRIRVAFLVDVHIGGVSTLNHLERVMKIVSDASPDIVMLGGDILDGDMSCRKQELELLREAAKNARYGAFAVNGNHEHYIILDVNVEGVIRECGYDLLINERRETHGITVLGLDDVKYGWIRPYLKPEDKERFVLLLKHRPGVPNDADGNFDLMLSGHTHGGQFWPLGYFKNMALHSRQGLTQKAGGYVYVSNGAGFNQAAMRLFVPPEVTIVDIVREK